MCSNEGRNTKKNGDKYMDSWSAGTDKWDRPTVPSIMHPGRPSSVLIKGFELIKFLDA